MNEKHDYLAIILVGGGSAWGRSPDKEKAIKYAIDNYRDWEVYFEVANVEVSINVVDVIGYGQCAWGSYSDGWLHGKNEATGKDEAIKRPVENVVRRTPKWRRKKK